MHDIEPYFGWLDDYDSGEDDSSPFYGEEYSEFYFSNTVYNYYIHPRWDNFGSNTLYLKILFADYDNNFAVVELIGEWNDCIYDDFTTLKRNVLEPLFDKGIYKFVLICENVLNFHGGDTDYYEEMYEELAEQDGWMCIINAPDHVIDEMNSSDLSQFVHYLKPLSELNWRPYKAEHLVYKIEGILNKKYKRLI